MKRIIEVKWPGCFVVIYFGLRKDRRRNDMEDVVVRLKELMDNEARSCSMDYGCITPLYVYRMWGGSVSIEKIEQVMSDGRCKK